MSFYGNYPKHNLKRNYMKNFETLEVGKTYKNGHGKSVKIIDYDDSTKYQFLGDNEFSYTNNGIFYLCGIYNKQNLIELIEDEPTATEPTKPDRSDSISALVEFLNEYENDVYVEIFKNGTYVLEEMKNSCYDIVIDGITEDLIQDITDDIMKRNRPFEYLEVVWYKGGRFNFFSYTTPFTNKDFVRIINNTGDIVIANVKNVKRI